MMGLMQVYAEVVGGLSAFTAVLYFIPFMVRLPLIFIWDTLLFFLWIVLFGIFGNVSFSSPFLSPPIPSPFLPTFPMPIDWMDKERH
jgi:hypothetical protein